MHALEQVGVAVQEGVVLFLLICLFVGFGLLVLLADFGLFGLV